jgi:hypothetical protein
MDTLKQNVMDIVNQVNQDWVNELKEAEKNNSGVDLSEMMGKFSANIKQLDRVFIEAKARLTKKKGMFR